MNDFELKFREIEKRIQRIVTENSSLKKRVYDLEHELGQARREAQGVELFHGKKIHVREKIEKILKSLEGIKKTE